MPAAIPIARQAASEAIASPVPESTLIARIAYPIAPHPIDTHTTRHGEFWNAPNPADATPAKTKSTGATVAARPPDADSVIVPMISHAPTTTPSAAASRIAIARHKRQIPADISF